MPELDFRDQTAIVGIGYSRGPEAPGGFSKNSGESVLTLAIRAAREAAADAGIDLRDIDGGITYQIGDSLVPDELLRAIRVKAIHYAAGIEGGGRYAALVAMMMAEAVHHGVVRYGLVYRAMNGRSGVRMGQLGGKAGGGSNRVAGAGQFTSIYGSRGRPPLTPSRPGATWTSAERPARILGAWAVNSRGNAAKNPRATMRTPITLEDHQNSRLIVDPYHLLDCCLETDVAVALIIARAEEARDLRKRPVLISAGIGGAPPVAEIIDTGMRVNGPRLLQAAGIELRDVDTFHPYDNFSDCGLRLLEDMGWCGRGEGGAFLRDGRGSLDGEIAVSTQGGLLSEGYAHGLNNLLEAAQQLRGEAEDLCPDWQTGRHTYDRTICRQVRDAQIAVHTSVVGTAGLVLRRG